MRSAPIPVWLVTGFLGSGKTTLLARWLREPGLEDAALVINELGEVGLDDRLLSSAAQAAELLAGGCVCCEGLAGLEETLGQLWWDRLERRRTRFGQVVVETTGMADPQPVLRAFQLVPLLRERYRLAGVITTVDARSAAATLQRHPEAQAQVRAADLLVITHADQVAPQALDTVAATLRTSHADATLCTSAQASLGWAELLAALPASAGQPKAWGTLAGGGHAAGTPLSAPTRHTPARTHFTALPQPLTQAALQALVQPWQDAGALRIKGLVQLLPAGGWCSVQWVPGDAALTLQAWDAGGTGTPPVAGLTCIAPSSPTR